MNLELQTKFDIGSYEITNFDELKKDISETIKKYNTLVVTKDFIDDAKEIRKKLNKFAKQIDEERKAREKAYMAAFVGKQQCNELIEIIKEASNNLDIQIKSYEDIDKLAKKEKIEEYFNNKLKEFNLKDKITFDQVFNDRWLNKTYSSEEIALEIHEKLSRVNEGEVLLAKLFNKEEDYERALNYLYKTLDLQETISLMDADFSKADKEKVEEMIEGKKESIPVTAVITLRVTPKRLKYLEAWMLTNNYYYKKEIKE